MITLPPVGILLAAAFSLCLTHPARPSVRLRFAGEKTTNLTSRLMRLSVAAGIAFLVIVHGRASIIVAGCIVTGCAYYLRREKARRLEQCRWDELYGLFLGRLGSELRAGENAEKALEKAQRVLDDKPASAASRRLRWEVSALRSGREAVSGCTAWNAEGPRVGAADGELRALWRASQRYGIALEPLVQHVRRSTDTRIRHRKATAASLQGPKSTATILTALPLAGMGLGGTMGAHPVQFLCGGGLGGALLVLGTALVSIGMVWSQRIIARAEG